MMGIPNENILRVCKRCGETYHPNSSRQECCNKQIQVPCIICGKPITQKCTFKHQGSTCSKECTVAFANQQRKLTANKITRKCKLCGKEFHPDTARDFYCKNPHYKTCEVCNKEFQIQDVLRPSRTCSAQCKSILVNKDRDMEQMVQHLKSTMRTKYGVDNPMLMQSTKNKIRETNRRKYGKDWYTQTSEYKEKVKQHDQEIYGVDHHLSSPIVIEKRRHTNQNKYGVDNPFQNEDVKHKMKETVKKRYGVDNISQSPEIHRRKYVNRQNNVASDGKIFDSSYECIFYEFLLLIKKTYPDLRIDTQVPIEFEYQNKKHITLIDFKVNDVYFEVKGSHLLSGVFSDKVQIPIDVKISVYKNNHVKLITDDIYDVSNIIDQGLVCFDIKSIKSTDSPIELWKYMMTKT